MRRTIRLAACSAAVVGLGMLGACESGSPVESVSVGGAEANLSAGVKAVQQQRLRDAGRVGLQAGLNTESRFAPPASIQQKVLEAAPADFTRPVQRPGLRVANERYGNAARPSAEQMASHRARGGTGYFEANSGDGVSAMQSFSYGGASWVDVWDPWWCDWIDYSSYTWASRNISYIDVIGDSYADGWWLASLYNYQYEASFAGVWWTYWQWWGPYAWWFSQYGDHFVWDAQTGWWHNFFTSAHNFCW